MVPRRPTASGTAALLPLSGDWEQSTTGNDANGIRTLPGGDLLVVDQGALLRVNPATGVATRLEQAAGRALTGGDGLELRGATVYVVYGFGEDSVATVGLDLPRGEFAVTGPLSKPGPTTDQEVVRVRVR